MKPKSILCIIGILIASLMQPAFSKAGDSPGKSQNNLTKKSQNSLLCTTSQTNVSCYGGNNGSCTCSPLGGLLPYLFSWSNGLTLGTITGLSAGTYTVTVTDALFETFTTSVTISQPLLLSASASINANVSCFGGDNGSATCSCSGGVSPYAFLWDNGQTTATCSGLHAGLHSCTVTDANGCVTIVSSINITAPVLALTASASINANVSCFGGDNGSATCSCSGGVSPYAFLWDNGQTTATCSGLHAGLHSCTVTDANGCVTIVSSINITAPALALTASASVNANVSCFGGDNGSATCSCSGGVSPYAFLWDNGQTTATCSGLHAGLHSCTVTDANGCVTIVSSINITQPATGLSASASINANVSCFGGDNGSATISVSGGVSPYAFLWDNGQTTATCSGLHAGLHSCTVTDANGCITIVSSINITAPAVALTASASVNANVSCFGGDNGSATVSVSGGVTPYVFLWSSGQTTATANNLSAGVHTCTVTDVNGCVTIVSSINITQPATGLSASASINANVSCFGGDNGSATVSVSGGVSPYVFLWSSGQTTATVNNLSAGVHTCTITDAHGCTTVVSSINITQPGVALSASASINANVSCYGGDNGSATVSVSGGVSPYVFLWSSGQTTATVNNLSAGVHTCTVTDVNGCVTIVSSINITQPATGLSASASINANVSCFGGDNGSATVFVSGGVSPYAFLWDNGQTTATCSGLHAGLHSCTVTDANGCITIVSSINITAPAVALTASASINANVSCFGGDNGSATCSCSGGVSPYAFLWSSGQTTATANNLSAGVHTCTVTDAHGCTTVVSSINITAPAVALTASASVNANVSCYGGDNGSATVSVSGGVTPYVFLWSSGQTTATVNNLSAGVHTCTVTDVNGCVTIVSSINITQPATGLSASASINANVSCFGGDNGSATCSCSGGVSPYAFLWSSGQTTATANNLSAGVHTCTVTDAHGCTTVVSSINITAPAVALTASASVNANVSCYGGDNGSATVSVSGGVTPYVFLWSSGQTTATVNNLSAGVHTCTVTDVNGCVTIVSSINITQPATGLSASASINANVSCFGGDNGSATVSVSGGVTPYVFLWSSGQTTATVNNLSAGVHTCTVTDANGCITIVSSINITQPATGLSASASINANVSCFGGDNGSATISVSGGVTPYAFLWSSGQTTATATNLSAGIHTCTVTDVHGCVTIVSSINITQPATGLSASASINANVSCFGGDNGSATISVSGGVSPYAFLWSSGQTTATATNLSAGVHTCTVTDVNGCVTIVSSINITQPATGLSASASVNANVSCYGGDNGSATISVSGGVSPYAFLWSSGQTTATVNNLSAGVHTCTVTDAHGCTTVVSSINITGPSALLASTSLITNVSCNGDCTGSAECGCSGGTAPYTFLWSNGETTAIATGLCAGTYTATVKDNCGTETIACITIIQPSPLSVSVTGGLLLGLGTARCICSGGTAPYTYLWSTGATTSSVTGLFAGLCSVTAKDHCGATVTASINIVINLLLSVPNIADSTGNVTLYPNPSTGQYTLSGLQKDMTLELYNYMGKKIRTVKASDDLNMQFNISNEANGVYLLFIINKDGTLISERKVIKVQ